MTNGLASWRADGTPILATTDAGGVFVGVIFRARSDGSGTISYPNLNGRTLRVVQLAAGSFTWAVGVDGSGNPYLTFTVMPASLNGTSIRLIVFAV